MSVFKAAATAIATKLGSLLILIGIIVIVVQVAYCRMKGAEASGDAAELALTKSRVAALTIELGGVNGELVKERSLRLTPKQKTFVTAIKKADKGATVSSVSTTEITIKDTAPGVVTETHVEDRHGRFRFDLPSGLLHREQRFTLDTVAIRGRDGSYRVQQTEFREFSPKTGEEIPSTGVNLKAHFEFAEEAIPGPGPWHPRIVAGVGFPFGVGAGVQFNPYKKFTVGAIALYQPDPKAAVGALTLGWRPLNSTLSVGPYAGISTRGGAFVGGVLATIELSR